MTSVTIRPLQASDADHWHRLWTDYLTFYGASVPQKVYETYFARLLGDDPQDYDCLIANLDGIPVGFTHFLFHRHGWTVENCCYLQDLYAAPEARGAGVGRALIEAVYAAADAAGAPSVYWLTQKDNVTARQLYDRVGEKTSFLKYKRV